MATIEICKTCHRPQDEHCIFDPYEVPDGCECDPRDWRDGNVSPICNQFLGSHDKNCEDCEHGIECHDKKGS